MSDINRVFRCKDGTMSTYALYCGYIDRVELNGLMLELYVEHGSPVVKVFNDIQCLLWANFENVTNAKRVFKKLRVLIKHKKCFLSAVNNYSEMVANGEDL